MPFIAAAALFGVFTATRLGLALFTGPQSVPPALWPGLLLKGLWFDAAVVSVVVAPLCLYEALSPLRPGRGRLVAAWLGLSLALFIAVAEALFWLEFSTRFNFIALDYLLYTHEVLGNIRESYPVAPILAAIALLSAAAVRLGRRALLERRPLPRPALAAALLLPAVLLGAADIGQMRGSGNALADELSGNGLFTLAAAARRNELDYDAFYPTLPQAEADDKLIELNVERIPLSFNEGKGADFDPPHDRVPFKRRPRNVVLITIESLSASFMDSYGAPNAGLTPNLDRLSRLGLKFERAFATGTRTVRGLEALSLGTPPVPGQAIVRRPGNEHLATLGGVLGRQGWSPLFLYGGYGYFDNMNAYFAGNGYRVIDRGGFPPESVVFANIWGVADESLYANALAAFDEEHGKGKPFFAHVMTTSNHRPYTYPDGRIDIPSPGGRDGAVKYTDWAVADFLEKAKTKPWFKDTLFVITADHCAAVAGRTSLPVKDYHIPLLFYAPDLLEPGVFPHLVSQIDLAPTLIEVLGARGDDHFFGRSIFADGPNPERVFISNYQELGYLRRGTLTVLGPRRPAESYRIDPRTYAATPAPLDRGLLAEAIAYYQTASRAFHSGALRPGRL